MSGELFRPTTGTTEYHQYISQSHGLDKPNTCYPASVLNAAIATGNLNYEAANRVHWLITTDSRYQQCFTQGYWNTNFLPILSAVLKTKRNSFYINSFPIKKMSAPEDFIRNHLTARDALVGGDINHAVMTPRFHHADTLLEIIDPNLSGHPRVIDLREFISLTYTHGYITLVGRNPLA